MTREYAHKRDWVDILLEEVDDPFSQLNTGVDYILWLLVAIVVAMIFVVLKGN